MKLFKTPKGTSLQIMDLKGKDYMVVQQRLIWFREENPLWSIETELITVTAEHALAKAIIKNDAGRIIATSHKSETAKGFFDFIEKAETGAVGRALLLCGYGTAFAASELDEGERLADSPVERGVKAVVPPKSDPVAAAKKALSSTVKGEITDISNCDFKMPFGDLKGTSSLKAPSNDLHYLLGQVIKSINDPSKAAYKSNNIDMKTRIETILAFRAQSLPDQQVPF